MKIKLVLNKHSIFLYDPLRFMLFRQGDDLGDKNGQSFSDFSKEQGLFQAHYGWTETTVGFPKLVTPKLLRGYNLRD